MADQQQLQVEKWTYDTANREKYPKGEVPPSIARLGASPYWEETVTYTARYFQENPGQLSKQRIYPITHQEANHWLEEFLTHRFYGFGPYEDASFKEASILHHSALSPLLNVGLIDPQTVVRRGLAFAWQHKNPNKFYGRLYQAAY